MKYEEIIERAIIAAGSDHLGVFGGARDGGTCIQQIPDEFSRFISRMADGLPVESYLEIGSAAGGTAYIVHHFLRPKRMVLIDDNAHPRHVERERVLQGIERVELIGRSQQPEIVEQAAAHAPYDLIFVDADHNYQATRDDADNYIPMLSACGTIAFHDSAITGWGVEKVVSELKDDDRLLFMGEFKSEKQKPLGIASFRRVE